MPEGLPFRLEDYFSLVDIRGRVIREDKRSAIEAMYPPILVRLGIDASMWSLLISSLEEQFSGPIGCEAALRRYQQSQGGLRARRLSATKRCFEAA
jgi:hypothetical protein